MKKIIIWLFENWLNVDLANEYIIKRAVKLPLKGELKTFVNKEYKKIAEKKLPLKTEIVKVKKGKSRHQVIFFETNKGQLKFNLGRHFEGVLT
jgi:hypothetical protein